MAACVDRQPVPCLEDGCPAPALSCPWLAKNDGCGLGFSDLWSTLPPGHEALSSRAIRSECPASCGACSADGLRAAVAGEPAPWPVDGALQPPAYLPGDASSEVLASAIAAASEQGPLVITDAYGAAFKPEAWSREALLRRCAPRADAPPPSPPWPTIAWADPGLSGQQWAAMRFENGALLGVRDLASLMGAQDDRRLRGVALFDSRANDTCASALLHRRLEPEGSEEGPGLPAPRFFPRDYEAALGGARGEGLWRKGGEAWGDPDLFASKAGTRTHVHVDSLCSRFWMLQLHGRKLWRVFPPNQTQHLHPAKRTEGGKGAHYLADTMAVDIALYPDLLKIQGGFEFALRPGEPALPPCPPHLHLRHNLCPRSLHHRPRPLHRRPCPHQASSPSSRKAGRTRCTIWTTPPR